ncbi:MAG: acyltransferase family protein [Lachnospiraceae bacterium]
MSFYLGQLSDFCVFGFAFLSGYVHMMQFDQEGYYKRRLKGLLAVFCSYWLILVVFSIVGITIGQGDYMPGSLNKFILNALTLENSYNGAWWYMFTYALLVVTSPVLLKWVKRSHPLVVLGIGFAIYCVAYYVRFKLGCSNWLLGKFGPFGMTLFEYMLGVLVLKYQVFTHIYKIWEKIPKAIQWLLAAVLMFGMLYVRTKVVPSLFVAPVTGFVVMTLFHFWNKPEFVKKAFLLVGWHSTNIWLTHMFFYSVMFKNLVYIAKYPLLVFAFMLAITIPLSVLLQMVERPIQKRITKI